MSIAGATVTGLVDARPRRGCERKPINGVVAEAAAGSLATVIGHCRAGRRLARLRKRVLTWARPASFL